MAKDKKSKKDQTKGPEAPTQYRIYKTGNGLYQQPFDPENPSKPPKPLKPFEGWRKHDGVGFEDLIKTRYVSFETYQEVRRTLGIGRKAMNYIFNTANNLDYIGIEEGVLFYIRKDRKLWHSSLAKRIEPGLNGNEVMIRPEKPQQKPEEVALEAIMDQADVDKGGTDISPSSEEDDEELDLAPEDPKADSQK